MTGYANYSNGFMLAVATTTNIEEPDGQNPECTQAVDNILSNLTDALATM